MPCARATGLCARCPSSTAVILEPIVALSLRCIRDNAHSVLACISMRATQMRPGATPAAPPRPPPPPPRPAASAPLPPASRPLWPMMKPHDVVDAPEVQAGQLSVTEIFAPAAKLWAEHCVPARAARLVCLRPAPRPRLAPASSPHALPLVSPPFPLPSPSPSHRPPSARRFDRHGFDRHGQARDVCSHSRRSVVSILRASGVARVY